ncbi:hypothetical protein HN512_01790 [Candidatus Peregrinibacteria bacterium]|jgi:peptidoglycan hydrolase CwlO-like protein|nr:hypothetical protein [Candidatus Peregrinibacteria bacterium]MBT3598546.1 hypothetical protein [Candidatus Peregrinibacteria bacterium]MBT4367623.1 hypothetical protein [Candidatus Peregrinibacteria bacterium]MBT4586207.1 hypothetical protein [Candidatus Peregrinibacteria bacterium]MBT6730486.1 hypothetical protein [Candidatus Peregrinibacteria bacterium]
MSSYLTIKEAADRAGKAEITIRRFVQSIVKDQPKSAGRKLIQPNPTQVRGLKKQKKPFSWKISEELLVKKFTTDVKAAKKTTDKKVEATGSVMKTLQGELSCKENQLEVKDKQIEALTEIVQSLNERMREGNVLMASLQKHLALPEGKEEGKKSWVKKMFS